MGLFDKYRTQIGAAALAITSFTGFSANVQADENTQSLDASTTASTQIAAELTAFEKFELEQQQQMDSFKLDYEKDLSKFELNHEKSSIPTKNTAPVNEKSSHINKLHRNVDILNKIGASQLNKEIVTKDGVRTTTVSHNGKSDVFIDNNGNVQVEEPLNHDVSYENSPETEAEMHRKRALFQEMNEKITDNNITAHTVNKDLREILAATECGVDISDDNILSSFTPEERSNIHAHMIQLDSAHTLDVSVLVEMSTAQCDKGISSEIMEEIQTNLEVKQGEDFAKSYNLDVDEVNIDYGEIER